MTAVSVATLRANAEQIRLETILRANTAQRVGQMLRDIIDSGTAGGFTNIEATGSDEQAAIQAALTAGNQTVFLQPGTHLISDRVTIGSNTTIDGAPGAILKLADGANEFCLTIAAGATNVKIRNIEIDGNKANNPSGGAGIQSEDDTATNILIENVHTHDCKEAGIYLAGYNIHVRGCTSLDNGEEGITGSDIEFFSFRDNYAARNGTHNVGLIGIGHYGLIDGNLCEDSGALADNLTGYNAANEYITWSNNVTRRGGNNGVHVGGSYVSFNNNTIEDATFYGLIARNHDVSAMPGFQASGNTITNSGTTGANSGVWLGNLVDFTWGTNTVSGSYAHGLLVQEGCTKGSITGGLYANNGTGAGSGSGIRLQSACSKITISGVSVSSNVSMGLRIQAATNVVVSGVISAGNSVPVTVDGASTDVRFIGNSFTGNTSDVPDLVAGTVSYYADSPSVLINTNVASAATLALDIFGYTDLFRVTGTTNITTITGGWFGRRITLRFTGILTMVTGGNLVIGGGTYTSANNSSLTLIYDGTNWYETGRMSP